MLHASQAWLLYVPQGSAQVSSPLTSPPEVVVLLPTPEPRQHPLGLQSMPENENAPLLRGSCYPRSPLPSVDRKELVWMMLLFPLAERETEAQEWSRGMARPSSHSWTGRKLGFKAKQSEVSLVIPSLPCAVWGAPSVPHAPHPAPYTPSCLAQDTVTKHRRLGRLEPLSLTSHLAVLEVGSQG